MDRNFYLQEESVVGDDMRVLSFRGLDKQRVQDEFDHYLATLKSRQVLSVSEMIRFVNKEYCIVIRHTLQ